MQKSRCSAEPQKLLSAKVLSSINGNNNILRCKFFIKVLIQIDRAKMKLKLTSNYSAV